jgi:hypothetical protein
MDKVELSGRLKLLSVFNYSVRVFITGVKVTSPLKARGKFIKAIALRPVS